MVVHVGTDRSETGAIENTTPQPLDSPTNEPPLDPAIVRMPVDGLSLEFSPREKPYDPTHVAALAEIFPSLPPILVHATTMQVIDGIHRVMAARRCGYDRISAELFHGSAVEASIEAVRRNVTHGKPLTVAERQAAASMVLGVHRDWSDRRIAEACGLSPMTVGRLRERATDHPGQLTVRVGRDGRSRPTDPVKLRHHVAEMLKNDPGATTRQVAERTGASQATVRDVRKRLERGDEVLSPRQARTHLKRHLESIPPPGPAVTVETLATPAPEVAEWYESRCLTADTEWEDIVDLVPISRVYELADSARRCAEMWLRFASALELRARQHRESKRGRSHEHLRVPEQRAAGS